MLVYRLTSNVDFQVIFPHANLAPPSVISKIFYLDRDDVNRIKMTNDMSAAELATRMAHVYLREWSPFLQEYHRYAYLYGIENERLENRFKQVLEVATNTFEVAQLFRVRIPRFFDLTNIHLLSELSLYGANALIIYAAKKANTLDSQELQPSDHLHVHFVASWSGKIHH
jgi:hypothetical protein